MGHRFLDLATTSAARRIQAEQGSRGSYARMEQGPARNDRLGDDEADFIAARDSFVMASVGDGGWPYVQHRGGPVGFLKVIDEQTLAFADYRGNRQYLSAGNVSSGNDRVALLLIDHAHRRRLKLLGHAQLVDLAAEPELARRVIDKGYDARVERAWRIRVEAFDWNCPQHIPQRFTLDEIEQFAR